MKDQKNDLKYNSYMREINTLNSMKEYLSENRDSMDKATKNYMIDLIVKN